MLKFYSKIIGSVENAIFFQSLALLLFISFFVGVVYLVMRKPKNYYKNMGDLPLDDEIYPEENKKY